MKYPQPNFRSVAIISFVGLGALVALILLSPRRTEKSPPSHSNVLPPPALPASVPETTSPNDAVQMGNFAAWNIEADNFLHQTWRTSRYSSIGANTRIGELMPAAPASFDHLIDALPAAKFWRQLPAVTRAKLSGTLPKTSAETLAWMDQRLLHVWALVLNLPTSQSELRSTLDEMRTVRWLVEKNQISEIPGRALSQDFANRLGMLDQTLRPKTEIESVQLPPAEIWREVARQAALSPADRLREDVGEEMYSRLRSVSSPARWTDRLSHLIPFGWGGSHREPGSTSDPVASALFGYGPLPHAANAALGLNVPGAPSDDIVKVPELVPELSEQEALPLIAAAIAAKASLDWTEAPQTLVFTAQCLADGRLHEDPPGLRYFLILMMNAWPEPVTPRAEAGLALVTALADAAPKTLSPEEAEDIAGVYRQYRALCLIALRRGREADALLGEAEFQYWEALNAFPPSAAAGVSEFTLLRLARNPGTSLHWWELMEANARLAGHSSDALALIKANKEKIDGNAEALLVTATEDAGQIDEAASLLREIVRRPYDNDGMAPTQRRADAIWELLKWGESHHRDNWSREALEQLGKLTNYWLTERDQSSDGGDPWGKWPGKLAELGRLELALSAAKLNVRWRAANSDIGQVFLMPETDRKNYIVNGPAAAMSGLVQVLALQKKPQAVIDYLGSEESWPARDLSEIASSFDPSFSEPQRKTLGLIVADALTALARNEEAIRVRSSLNPGWQRQVREFLSSVASASIAKERRIALEYLLSNELPSDAKVDLVDIASAVEGVPFVLNEQAFPRDVFPLAAASARLNLELTLGEKVPVPPIENLRTHVISSATDLAPIRNALLANVPGSRP